MARATTLRYGLLDVAGGIGMTGPALMVLYSYDVRPAWISALIVTFLACSAVLWLLWRRSAQRRRSVAVAFAVMAVLIMSLGNGALFYGIIWSACLILGVTFRSTTVLWGYAAVLVATVVTLHVTTGSPAEAMATEAVGAAVLSGIAAATAVVLRDSLRVTAALREAVAERDAAHHELTRRFEAERDLVLAQERERSARELHDDVGHRLTAVGFSLDFAMRTPDSDAAHAELAHARAVVGDSLDALRRLVRAMHPVELGRLDDIEAFRAVARAFDGTSLDVSVTVAPEGASLSRAHALLLLRFAQEGLTNVVRHANATRAHLTIAAESADGAIKAVLIDDGSRESGHESWSEGFGLRSLRSRAATLGGTVEAEMTDVGFRLTMSLPMTAEPPSDDAARTLEMADV